MRRNEESCGGKEGERKMGIWRGREERLSRKNNETEAEKLGENETNELL